MDHQDRETLSLVANGLFDFCAEAPVFPLRTAQTPDNQVLEFLGDGVLDLATPLFGLGRTDLARSVHEVTRQAEHSA